MTFSTSPRMWSPCITSNSVTAAVLSLLTLNVVGPALAEIDRGSQPASDSVTSMVATSLDPPAAVLPLELLPDEPELEHAATTAGTARRARARRTTGTPFRAGVRR